MISRVKNMIFDFDGVIIDSMHIRTEGFREIFSNYDDEVVNKLIKYHLYNAGLSRFHKIKYFYNELLNKQVSDEEIQIYADKFTNIMRLKLTSKDILIKDTIDFIKRNYNTYNFHIASGSEENELKFLCNKLDIDKYFKSIKGSPIHKNDLVRNIINDNNYSKELTVMIGDSINDYEAATVNGIKFLGYNNLDLKGKDGYINTFMKFNV